jgi:hypothetical protein
MKTTTRNDYKNLGNNWVLVGGTVQHRFSSAYYDLNTKTGNVTLQPWLLERATKLNK